MDNSYTLLDSGNGRKLERFGPIVISRPCAQAVWNQTLSKKEWERADGVFTREDSKGWLKGIEKPWECTISEIRFKLATTDFGHLGVFPEQALHWRWMNELIASQKREVEVLNLFAYSGGATLACAKGGARVCHLDASKGMIAWARENCALNGLNQAPIRWICDDVMKFLAKEERREKLYDAIILDPPSYGRGAKGEVFKIEEKIIPLLQSCQKLLKKDPLFFLFSCHTTQFSPLVMKHLVEDLFGFSDVEVGEMAIEGKRPLPSGTFARWQR
jgi:23S rRNA (cytosine1962-C5)-methyltransferase